MSSPIAPATWKEAGAIWIGSRAPLLLVTAIAAFLLPGTPGDPWYLSQPYLRNPFAVGDAGWYMSIAEGGYRGFTAGQSNIAFFPLYPLSVRALRALGLGPWASGLLVSNLAFLVALWVLLELGRTRLGLEPARRGAVYLAVFPFSYFFSHYYAESLFLALTLAAFLAAERRRWWVCAVLGFLAALTRPQGILLVVPLGIWAIQSAWQALRAEPRTADERPTADEAPAAEPAARPLWRATLGPVLAIIGPVLGLGLFTAYVAWLTGDPFNWLRAHQAWSYELGMRPWDAYAIFASKVVHVGWYNALISAPHSILYLVGAVPALAFLVLLVPVGRHLGLAYAAWAVAMLLVAMGAGSWEGLGRYCAVTFPVFLAMGRWQSPTVTYALGLGSAILLGLFGALFASGYPLV